MDGRSNRHCYLLSVRGSGIGSSCGYTQQSRFQMSTSRPPRRGSHRPSSLLPYRPMSSWAPIFPPSFSTIHRFWLGPRPIPSSAQRVFRAASGTTRPRIGQGWQVDRAIDLMFEASEQDVVDRQDFERKLDEMVDSIHRYDLGDLARPPSSIRTASRRPMRHPQMTFPVDPQLKDRYGNKSPPPPRSSPSPS